MLAHLHTGLLLGITFPSPSWALCVCGWRSVIVVLRLLITSLLGVCSGVKWERTWVLVLGLGWLLPAPPPLGCLPLEEFSVVAFLS